MRYCFDHAIPHSQFLEWAPEDKAKIMAFMQEQGLRCDMCGTASWEWEDDPHAYTPVDKFCKGCYIKNASSEGRETLPGTTIVLQPLSKAEKAKMSIAAEKKAKRKKRDLAEDARHRR